MANLSIKSAKPKEVIDVTELVQQEAESRGFKEGLCNLFLAHTTCAITTADLDPGTDLDMLDFLEAILPKIKYRHPHDPSHTPSHILSAVIGTSLTIPVVQGKLQLGSWQRIVLLEFDGPRERELICSFLPVVGE